MKKIAKAQLAELWQKISQTYDLFLPVEKDGKVNFRQWHQNDQVNLDRLKTEVSPKHLIFNQNETYLKFKTDGKKLSFESVGNQQGPYVLFRVRPCDAAAFQLIDNVFLNDPVDGLYQERRNNGTIISLACSEPEESCFCTAFGLDAHIAPKGVDVAVWDVGDTILWQPQSEKGNILTEKLADVLAEATPEDEKACKELQEDIKTKLQELPLAGLDPHTIPADIKQNFESEIWDDFAQRCLGCGVCTYVCPTCHCYDIQDFDGGREGERFRCWDSCMFSDFTQMAHGNHRTTQKERFRQRFMHKLVYYPNKYGRYACVGCGRCLTKCPVNANIVKVIRKLGSDKV